MKNFILLAGAVSLSACSNMNPPACMAENESGTVETINRISYTDTCHGPGCKDHPEPDWDTLVVGFRMSNGTQRICRGRWYPEASTLEIGKRATVTRLARGKL